MPTVTRAHGHRADCPRGYREVFVDDKNEGTWGKRGTVVENRDSATREEGREVNESSRPAGSVSGPELAYAAKKLIRRRRWTSPSPLVGSRKYHRRRNAHAAASSAGRRKRKSERGGEEREKKNRETELRRAARRTVTLFRDRDPKCARDTRAGINKYTRLRERRDCVRVCVRKRERESVGSIVCDFSCAPRGVFRWQCVFDARSREEGRRRGREPRGRGECSKREVAAGVRDLPRVHVRACTRVWLGPRLSPLGLLLFSYGGYVEKDWPPNARTANPVSCWCSGANGRCSLDVCWQRPRSVGSMKPSVKLKRIHRHVRFIARAAATRAAPPPSATTTRAVTTITTTKRQRRADKWAESRREEQRCRQAAREEELVERW